MIPQDHTFKTPDTSLAAYLYSEGENLCAIEMDKFGTGFFVFTGSETLDRKILDWSDGNPYRRYYESYRYMLRALSDKRKATTKSL